MWSFRWAAARSRWPTNGGGQGRFSIRANIARGNVWAFFPSDAAFHLIAKTVRGKIANDFAEQGGSAAKETSKVDALIHSGDEAAIQMHVRKGNIKIVEQNP